MRRITSVEDHKLNAAFQTACRTLTDSQFADRLDKPVAFWALPSDRRLPMALLGYTLRQLIEQNLDELASTPGIGKKKIHSLIKLLNRASKDQPPAFPEAGDNKSDIKRGSRNKVDNRTGFDPSGISEVLWEQWRNTVKQCGVGHEPLGRLAPSLQGLPTVIWHTPLETYGETTIADIRQLKTHGEKRLRAILEVFYSVHEMLAATPRAGHLHLRMTPKFIAPVEQWISETLVNDKPPVLEVVQKKLTLPLLEQLKIDTGATIFRLAEERLGIRSAPQRVHQQAKRLGVTRARVYQLLETCAQVMLVRWPEGQALMKRLIERLAEREVSVECRKHVAALFELLYPNAEAGSSEAGD